MHIRVLVKYISAVQSTLAPCRFASVQETLEALLPHPWPNLFGDLCGIRFHFPATGVILTTVELLALMLALGYGANDHWNAAFRTQRGNHGLILAIHGLWRRRFFGIRLGRDV